jgi:hypothetical protein
MRLAVLVLLYSCTCTGVKILRLKGLQMLKERYTLLSDGNKTTCFFSGSFFYSYLIFVTASLNTEFATKYSFTTNKLLLSLQTRGAF